MLDQEFDIIWNYEGTQHKGIVNIEKKGDEVRITAISNMTSQTFLNEVVSHEVAKQFIELLETLNFDITNEDLYQNIKAIKENL